MTDTRIMQIAREYLNASGKVPTLEDMQALPMVFDIYREFDRGSKRTRRLGRNESQFRSYLEDVRQWTFHDKSHSFNQGSLFE